MAVRSSHVNIIGLRYAAQLVRFCRGDRRVNRLVCRFDAAIKDLASAELRIMFTHQSCEPPVIVHFSSVLSWRLSDIRVSVMKTSRWPCVPTCWVGRALHGLGSNCMWCGMGSNPSVVYFSSCMGFVRSIYYQRKFSDHKFCTKTRCNSILQSSRFRLCVRCRRQRRERHRYRRPLQKT